MGATLGVWGDSDSTSGSGVAGYADATSGYTNGVYGQSASTNGNGVSGNAIATTGNAYGVNGTTATTGFGAGVAGDATATTGTAFGVLGKVQAQTGKESLVLPVRHRRPGWRCRICREPERCRGPICRPRWVGVDPARPVRKHHHIGVHRRCQRQYRYKRQSDSGREQVGQGETTGRAGGGALRCRKSGELVSRFRARRSCERA